MHQIRENADGSHRLLTQSEANREDVNNAVGAVVAVAALSSGAPITFIAWLPIALLYGFWTWAQFAAHGFIAGVIGLVLGLIVLVATLRAGVKLKNSIGVFSGILGLFLIYVFIKA